MRGDNGKKATLCKCRFSFPRPECDAFRLHDPAKAKARNRRLYDLPRTSDEISINDYNAVLLLTWKANIDVSFVADAAHGLANYVGGYTTKGERSQLEELADDRSRQFQNSYSAAFSFGAK